MKTIYLLVTVSLFVVRIGFANYGSELTSFDFGTSDIVRDDTRDRVYCTVPATNSVVVIDSETLNQVASIFTGSNPQAMDISSDGAFLYVANSGTIEHGITVIDLDALNVSHHIATVGNTRDVSAGLDGVVYSLESQIRAYDATSGAVMSGAVSGVYVYGGTLDISPDRQTLYYHHTGLSPSSWFRIDVSSWPGQSVQSASFGSNGQGMDISADGQFVSFASGSPYSIKKLSAADPTISYGTMATGAYPRAVAFSTHGDEVFAVHTSGHIDVWNASTFVKTLEISTTGEPRDLECDRTGRVLFAGSSTRLAVYYVSREQTPENVTASITNAVEIRWDSLYGTLYQVQWRGIGPGQSGDWYDLGGSTLGNGLTMSVFDTTRNQRKKFYRVLVVTP